MDLNHCLENDITIDKKLVGFGVNVEEEWVIARTSPHVRISFIRMADERKENYDSFNVNLIPIPVKCVG